MTDIGKALALTALTVSRVSRIVKAGNESMARGKTSMILTPMIPVTPMIPDDSVS